MGDIKPRPSCSHEYRAGRQEILVAFCCCVNGWEIQDLNLLLLLSGGPGNTSLVGTPFAGIAEFCCHRVEKGDVMSCCITVSTAGVGSVAPCFNTLLTRDVLICLLLPERY